MTAKRADGKGIFITTNVFTTEAVMFAENEQIELIDGDALIKLIRSVVGGEEMVPSKEHGSKVCPECGGALVKRSGHNGDFWGCSNFSRSNCRYTRSA